MSGARTTGVKRRKRTVAELERENAHLRNVIERIAAAVDREAARECTAGYHCATPERCAGAAEPCAQCRHFTASMWAAAVLREETR